MCGWSWHPTWQQLSVQCPRLLPSRMHALARGDLHTQQMRARHRSHHAPCVGGQQRRRSRHPRLPWHPTWLHPALPPLLTSSCIDSCSRKPRM